MPRRNLNYTIFSSFVLRTPIFPIAFFRKITEGTYITDDTFINILNDSKIIEAIFLASPEFYIEIQKWLMQKNYPKAKVEKVKLSILKYLIRMSTRCTPFGLFASCGAGQFTDKNVMIVDSKKSFYRKTRFDMHFLSNIGNALELNKKLSDKLLFYPNSTLYQIGDFYRYVEYFIKQDKRKYSLEALKKTEYLDLILKTATTGKKKKELATILISDEINICDASAFIDELIACKVLVSELEITLTGDDYINLIYKIISKIDEPDNQGYQLKELNSQLNAIDSEMNNPISSYENIIKSIKKINIPFNQKYLFQTDLFLNSKNFQLDKKYIKEIIKTINVLNKISESPQNSPLENFKKAFLDRYDSQTIPLVTALDVETGIGYLQKNNNFDSTPILDSIGIKQEEVNVNTVANLAKVEKIIHTKLQNALSNDENCIELNYNDFDGINFRTENLPATFFCVFEIVIENGKEWIVMQSIGGSSAANLLTRFCYGNNQINDFVNEIIKYEMNFFTDKIIAEIIHLPEIRMGNVLRRPNFRLYEIPYLAQSNLPQSNQIEIEDLLLTVKNDRLVIWSKKHDKEVIPRLTNAHNYSNNTLPIYRFLCDMQFENCKSSIQLNFNNLEKLFDYFPRITIENCIVSKAKWTFNKEKIPYFFALLNQKKDVNNFDICNLIATIFPKSLPQYVSLLDGDNILTIDTKNSTCLKMLFDIVKNRSQFVLEEYLFPSDSLVTNEQDYYGNQFIVGIKSNINI